MISDLFIKRKAKSLSFQPYYQFYNSSSVIENIHSHLTFEYQSLRTKMNDTSSLLQVREINSDTEEKVQSLEYQTVSETINTEKSKLVMELNDRNNIEICKVSLVPNYEIVNAGYEDYIFYEKVKYTIDEFLENQQKEIESLTEDNRLLEDYLSNEHKEINKDILALQKKIDKLEKWHLTIQTTEKNLMNLSYTVNSCHLESKNSRDLMESQSSYRLFKNDLRSRAKARIFKTGLDNEASIDFPFFMGILWIEMTGADGI
ncbi:hypothetical protein C2G38_2215591 [Gigaspora rosea]|uniref:Uncharacterized protein n=1 Tax=Gigaspora rosea TaxID=44941 RepID=A0A397UA41_9GLOM|nr:hypothetical protein C2G38_2215591 [Gigaspora rosea]